MLQCVNSADRPVQFSAVGSADWPVSKIDILKCSVPLRGSKEVILPACCSALQCVAVCCRVLPCVAVCCSVLQCVAVRCNVLQCVAVRCNVLQCLAVRCSVLQCFQCVDF